MTEPRQTDDSRDEAPGILAAAKARCLALGLRWTAARQRALELLVEAGRPLRVYELLESFNPGRKTTPPTVYRAFDALVEIGAAHRVASLNAYMLSRPDRPERTAFLLICEDCGLVEEIVSPDQALSAAVHRQSTFAAQRIAVEAHGRCAACTAHAARAARIRGRG